MAGKLYLWLTKQRSCKHSAYDSTEENWREVVNKIDQAYSKGASVKLTVTFNKREDGKKNK